MTAAVTVLMPVHNGEAFVGEAIASILRQTWRDFELLVVDDGSADRTAEIVASFRDPRIRVVTNGSRQGIARSLNRGLAASGSPLIARHDADDVSHPERLATQVAFLKANPRVAVVGAQIRVIDACGRVSHAPGWWRALTHEGIRFQSMFDTPVTHGSAVFRRERTGEYDSSLASAEDFDLWSRVAEREELANVPEKLLRFRVHAASTAAQYAREHVERSAVIVGRNLRSVLATEDVLREWPRLLASLHVDPRTRGNAVDRSTLEVIERICSRYFELHPGRRRSRDIGRVAAGKFAQIALLLAARDRIAAMRAFGRAIGFDAATASAYATRFGALVAFGERARGWRRR